MFETSEVGIDVRVLNQVEMSKVQDGRLRNGYSDRSEGIRARSGSSSFVRCSEVNAQRLRAIRTKNDERLRERVC